VQRSLAVDAQTDVTITALAEAHAYLMAIRQLDVATGIWHNFYPEGEPMECTVGAECWINFGLQNDGSAAGTIYCKVTRLDTSTVIYNRSFSLGVGEYVEASTDAPHFVMPSSNVMLRIEIGHY